MSEVQQKLAAFFCTTMAELLTLFRDRRERANDRRPVRISHKDALSRGRIQNLTCSEDPLCIGFARVDLYHVGENGNDVTLYGTDDESTAHWAGAESVFLRNVNALIGAACKLQNEVHDIQDGILRSDQPVTLETDPRLPNGAIYAVFYMEFVNLDIARRLLHPVQNGLSIDTFLGHMRSHADVEILRELMDLFIAIDASASNGVSNRAPNVFANAGCRNEFEPFLRNLFLRVRARDAPPPSWAVNEDWAGEGGPVQPVQPAQVVRLRAQQGRIWSASNPAPNGGSNGAANGGG